MNSSATTSALTVGRASGKPESVVGGSQQATGSLPTSALANRWRRTTLALAAAAVVFFAARPARAVDPKKVFNQRCTACHTFGKGVKVGPDLKGVTVRRQRPWLLTFIRSSQRVIASGDPVANELFRTFKRQRMPDWADLSPQDVSAILDWLAADGPEQKPADERDAELAGAAEVARARRAVRRTNEAGERGPRLRRLPHRERPRPAHGRHAGPRADRHLPQVPRSRADAVAAAPVYAAAAGARLGPLPRARGGVRAERPICGRWRSPPRRSPATRSPKRNEDSHERTCAQLSVSGLALPGVDAGGGRLRRPHAAHERSPARREARVAARAAAVGRRLAVAGSAGRCWWRPTSRACCFRGRSSPGRARPGALFALEALGFAVGLVVLAACIRAAWQHTRVQPRGGWSLLSDFADSVFLSLLFIGVASGLLAAGLHRWGSAWGSVMIAPLRGRRCCMGTRCRRWSSTCRSWFACTCSRRSRRSPRSRPAGWPCSRWCGRTARSRSRAARSQLPHGRWARGCAAKRRRGCGRSAEVRWLAKVRPTAAHASPPTRGPGGGSGRSANGAARSSTGARPSDAPARHRASASWRSARAAGCLPAAPRASACTRAMPPSSRSRSRTRSTPATTRSPACTATSARAPAGTPASRRPACA